MDWVIWNSFDEQDFDFSQILSDEVEDAYQTLLKGAFRP